MRRTLLVPTRLRHPTRLAASVLAGAALLSVPACGGDGGTDVSTAGTSTAATSTGHEQCTAPAANSAATPVAPGSAISLLREIGARRTQCGDEIVFRFANVAPGYTVQYERGPFTAGESGEPITIEGSAFLQITLAPASGVDLSKPDAPATYTGASTILTHGATDHVREIRRLSDFEGQMVWVIGLDEVRPLTASTLEDPDRVMIDFG